MTRRCAHREILFQSTLPAGGATAKIYEYVIVRVISIHAPRGGSDRIANLQKTSRKQFQSTLPAGGATKTAGRPYA